MIIIREIYCAKADISQRAYSTKRVGTLLKFHTRGSKNIKKHHHVTRMLYCLFVQGEITLVHLKVRDTCGTIGFLIRELKRINEIA